MSSTNYEMSTTTTVPSIEMNKLNSLYIPRVFANLSTEYVAEIFESLNLGVVDRVDAVPRPGDKKTYMAFVYFSSWNSQNKAAANLAERINCPTPGATQARIVYDDPWFWILLPNKSEKTSASRKLDDEALAEFNRSNDDICDDEWELLQKRKENRKKIDEALHYWDEKKQKREEEELAQKEMEDAMAEQEELNNEETIDILTDMVEDLQERLLESEKRVKQFEKELCDVRTILLAECHQRAVPDFPSNSYDTQPMSASVFEEEDIAHYPPPPRLVRQNAVACPPPPPPRLVRQTQVSLDWCQYCCQDKCGCRLPSRSEPVHEILNTLPKTVQFDEFMRSTIAKHMAEGDDAPPTPEHQADWWPSEQEIAEYRQDRHQRRMEQACIEQVRVDDMGLVYPSCERDNNFWCDP